MARRKRPTETLAMMQADSVLFWCDMASICLKRTKTGETSLPELVRMQASDARNYLRHALAGLDRMLGEGEGT